MEREALEKRLELDQDELVLWSGRPAPFIVMDQYYKPELIRRYVIAICIIVPILVAAFIYDAAVGRINLVALGVLCCLPLIIIPAGHSQYTGYGKKCEYFFTNKNLILIWDFRKVKLSIDAIETFDAVQQSEGTVSIRIGKFVGVPVKKNRDYALKCLNQNEDERLSKDGILYNLHEKDAGIVLELIDKYRVVA